MYKMYILPILYVFPLVYMQHIENKYCKEQTFSGEAVIEKLLSMNKKIVCRKTASMLMQCKDIQKNRVV